MSSEREARAAVWRERLLEWEASGLSGAAWCREQQLVYAQFAYWRRRLRADGEAESASFVAVEVGSAPAASGVSVRVGEVELVLAREFDAACLVRVVAALQGMPC